MSAAIFGPIRVNDSYPVDLLLHRSTAVTSAHFMKHFITKWASNCGQACSNHPILNVGWSGGEMKPANMENSRTGPAALAVGVGGDCLDIFFLVCHFSLLSPSLRETV